MSGRIFLVLVAWKFISKWIFFLEMNFQVTVYLTILTGLTTKSLKNKYLKPTTLSILWSLCLLLFVTSCHKNSRIQEIATPCKIGGEPNLHISKDGQAFLSWVEYLNDTMDVLAFADLADNKWSSPKIIAKGSNWFVNWADFPALVTFNDNSDYLAAHWLQKSATGTYDYDIRITQSLNGGKEWQSSFVPHTDGIAAEHGFVSMIPVGKDQIFATWLDGRYTKTENHSDGHDHEGQGGAMTLRGVFFDKKGNLSGDIELDNKVCDCCSTSTALTQNGVIVAYRDRSDGEIRDISIVRQIGQDWTRPRNLYTDKWEIAGCPVNGPKIIADGANKVAVAWYTMAGNQAQVKVSLSSDAGANFSKPIQIDEGNPLGRVDLVFDNNNLIVSWLENSGNEKAAIRLAKVQSNGQIDQRMTVAQTNSARSSGFPIMEKLGNQLLIAWTEILDENENTTVRTALVNF